MNLLSQIIGGTDEADQPAPNRAQRRAQKKHDANQQRRAQKSHNRATLKQRKAQVEARRELVRQGAGFFVQWNAGKTVFALTGTAKVDGKRIPVVALDIDTAVLYFDDRFGKTSKGLRNPDSAPSLPDPIEVDLDTFQTRAVK